MDSKEYDVELLLPRVSKESSIEFGRTLPSGYSGAYFEEEGYGFVIRGPASYGRVDLCIDEQIQSFLFPIRGMANVLRNAGCLLRVGVFSSFAITIDSYSPETIALVQEFRSGIEIWFHPVNP